MTHSDATDRHDRPSFEPFLTRWPLPLPLLLAASAALTAAALVLALAAPTGRGTTDPHGPTLNAGHLAPAQAARAQAQATADRFAQAFARSLRGPITTSTLRAAGAAPDLARRIAAQPSRATPTSDHSRSGAGGPRGAARVLGVSVQPDHGGWLATATVLLPEPRTRDGDVQQRLPLTFRLEPRQGQPRALVVVDANGGSDE